MLNLRTIKRYLVAMLWLVVAPTMASDQEHYAKGSVVDPAVSIVDAAGERLSLRTLLDDGAHELAVVMLFGGGGFGHSRAEPNGGLWCHDSYGDMPIGQRIVEDYAVRVKFIAIAVPPIFHTQYFGLIEGALINPDSLDFDVAVDSFKSSTLDAYESGLIPVQPYFDVDFALLESSNARMLKDHTPAAWYGSFRAPDETQTYGVPAFWVLSREGEVLTEPFRGNVYENKDTKESIVYRADDLLAVLDALLAR